MYILTVLGKYDKDAAKDEVKVAGKEVEWRKITIIPQWWRWYWQCLPMLILTMIMTLKVAAKMTIAMTMVITMSSHMRWFGISSVCHNAMLIVPPIQTSGKYWLLLILQSWPFQQCCQCLTTTYTTAVSYIHWCAVELEWTRIGWWISLTC